MIAVREALSIGSQELTKKGIINSLFETKLLIKNILKISDEDLISTSEVFLSESQFETFQSFLERRKKSEPIAYILNKREFWKDSFYVNDSWKLYEARSSSSSCSFSAFKRLDWNNLVYKG